MSPAKTAEPIYCVILARDKMVCSCAPDEYDGMISTAARMRRSLPLLWQIIITRSHRIARCGLMLPVTAMSCAETPEQIEMPFGMWTQMDPRSHVLGEARIQPGKGQFLETSATSPGPSKQGPKLLGR